MGIDPSKSVLDRWCRAHDVPNLFVPDASCFVTSAGANPALTIQAIAFRTADYIIKSAKQLDL
jgi:choline dehydrogenase-like flavoprotein